MTDVTTTNPTFQPNKYVSFADDPGGPPAAPYNWPQETLKVPNGFGGVPVVNDLNANMVNREPFGLSTMFTLITLPPGLDYLSTIQVPADGDFWLDSIAATLVTEQAGVVHTLDVTYLLLQLTDVGTGYKFFPSGNAWDGTNLGFFAVNQNFAPSGGFASIPGQPIGAGARTSLIQPYCFLRNTSIEAKVSNPGPSTALSGLAVTLHVNLMGWKEYSYAAR